MWFKHFGVSTIPFLAGSGFLMIGTLMAIAWRNDRRALAADADGGDADGAVEGAAVGEADEIPTVQEEEQAGSSRGLLLGAVALIAVALVGAVVAFAALGDDDSGSATTTETQTTIPLAGDPVNGKVVVRRDRLRRLPLVHPCRSEWEGGAVRSTRRR